MSCAACRTTTRPSQRLAPGSRVPRGSAAAARADAVSASVARALDTPGRALEPPLRGLMEGAFGQDFSAVRVHSEAAAAASARELEAQAYTVGSHIVFGAGHFQPGRSDGLHLLAHEVAHTVQQRRGAAAQAPMPRALSIGAAGDALESEAERAADRVLRGEPAVSMHGVAGAPLLQREPVRTPPRPEPERPPDAASPAVEPKCGPDATDWFVAEVNAAMLDPAVLAVQTSLATVGWLAPWFGLSTAQIGEAGATSAVLGQEARLGARAPARSADASRQLAAGTRSVGAVTAAAPRALGPPTTISPIPSPSAGAAAVMIAALSAAALGWRALVNHGARYDFKAHVLNHPRSLHCPEEGCPPGEVGTVTLCPGAAAANCYESDLPGNLFYACIGRFVGWSELTLQLGSQMAELTDVTPRPTRPAVTWDTPDDTAAIALGFALPLPLSRAALRGALGPARPSLAARSGCSDCPEPVR